VRAVDASAHVPIRTLSIHSSRILNFFSITRINNQNGSTEGNAPSRQSWKVEEKKEQDRGCALASQNLKSCADHVKSHPPNHPQTPRATVKSRRHRRRKAERFHPVQTPLITQHRSPRQRPPRHRKERRPKPQQQKKMCPCASHLVPPHPL
jgi:hypothetical protein